MCTHTYNFGSIYKALSMLIPLTLLLNSSFPAGSSTSMSFILLVPHCV